MAARISREDAKNQTSYASAVSCAGHAARVCYLMAKLPPSSKSRGSGFLADLVGKLDGGGAVQLEGAAPAGEKLTGHSSKGCVS